MLTQHEIYLDRENHCTWRPTPWDARALAVPTADVRNFCHRKRLGELFELIDQQNRGQGIGICCFRHSANDLEMKREAMRHGFALTEFSLVAQHSDIGKLPPPRIPFTFTRVTPEDCCRLDQIRKIATDTFNHGRFHEDPWVAPEQARERYALWINDLAATAGLYAWELKGDVAGFFSYRIDAELLDLPLSGLAPCAQRMGGFFWNAMFSFIHEMEQVKSTEILISGANTAVINLYAHLGFTFAHPVFGYHKHYYLEAP